MISSVEGLGEGLNDRLWEKATFADNDDRLFREPHDIERVATYKELDEKRVGEELRLKGFYLWSESQHDNLRTYALFKFDSQYALRKAYEAARTKGDPLLSPHGFFRGLGENKQNKLRHALEFLHNFGRLTFEGPPHLRPMVDRLASNGPQFSVCAVDISDFWARHARFVAVCRLWETRDSSVEHRKAWVEFRQKLDQIRTVDVQNVSFDVPWELKGKSFEEFIALDHAILVDVAIHRVVLGELNNRLKSRRPLWIPFPTQAGVGLRLTHAGLGDLWNALWEFFGLDQDNGVGWRICPHCGKIFYPARRDRFYCTTRQQTLASKRNWFNQNRDALKRGSTRKTNSKETSKVKGGK